MTFEVPKGTCAHCAAVFETGTWGDGLELHNAPAPGNLVVCLMCAGVNELTTAGSSRSVSDGDLMLMNHATQARILQMRQNVKTIRRRS